MQQKLQQEQDHSKIYRVHNPITNPIEYHIDNPYFINKMQSKFEIPTDLNRFLRS